MKIAVYDTYVPKNEHTVMHFDILVRDNSTSSEVYRYGKDYLSKKGISDYQLTTRECKFCHMEMASEQIKREIDKKGYFIIEMENC